MTIDKIRDKKLQYDLSREAAIEDQGTKHVEALKASKPEEKQELESIEELYHP